jgi:F-type H+-transporting ATPase subunit gamma
VLESRPYSEQLIKLLARLARQAAGEEDFPLMRVRPVRSVAVVLVTPDRGLAGALPGNMIRRAAALATELQRENANVSIKFIAVGRKGRDWVLRARQDLIAEFTNLGDRPSIADVRAIARTVTDAFIEEQVDQVQLIYPRFVSLVSQVPTVIQLLPAQPPADEAEAAGPEPQYIFEPDAVTVFSELLPRYVETLIYQPLLESVASFYSAQMVAMQNATDNATELVADLQLTYNKVRQTAITTQILEVVAGAAAV